MKLSKSANGQARILEIPTREASSEEEREEEVHREIPGSGSIAECGGWRLSSTRRAHTSSPRKAASGTAAAPAARSARSRSPAAQQRTGKGAMVKQSIVHLARSTTTPHTGKQQHTEFRTTEQRKQKWNGIKQRDDDALACRRKENQASASL